MKKIILTSFLVLFLFNCGSSFRSDYIAGCLEETPGGSGYEAMCECAFDRGVGEMSSAEETALFREFSEPVDQQYQAPVFQKLIAAAQSCSAEMLQ